MTEKGFYEFFAGGGMARAGLGPDWTCLFANDIDPAKAAAYAANWGADAVRLADVATLAPADLPDYAALAWASFPCQDLSLAGRGEGLKGGRSGLFWAFHRLMAGLGAEGRAPAVLALENVVGLLTSRSGADFRALVSALEAIGYRVGALTIDAARFTPQSRPRVFVIAVRTDIAIPTGLVGAEPTRWCASPALLRAATATALWWRLPEPPARNIALIDLIETAPADAPFHSPQATARLLSLMDPVNLSKVEARRAHGGRHVGAVYRRTRPDGRGGRVQRAEVRFDGLAGCLRTPAGGSSRQTLLLIDDGAVASRLLSAREAARLMGLGEEFRLPKGYTAACHLLGDGVAAPVVAHLARHLFAPLLAPRQARARTAA